MICAIAVLACVAALPLCTWFSPRALAWTAALCMARRHAIIEQGKAQKLWMDALDR